MFMGLRVEENCRPSSVARSQSTIVLSILYYIHCAYYLQIANIWSFSLLCMHTYLFLLLKVSTQTSVVKSNGVGRSRTGAGVGVRKGRAGNGARKG